MRASVNGGTEELRHRRHSDLCTRVKGQDGTTRLGLLQAGG